MVETVLPAGEMGGIYMRRPAGPEATYMGADVEPMLSTVDGFVTVGDMGRLDEEGYLYVADRRVDMIVTGAVNVFPAEVEAALSEHPAIADVIVVGLRDPEWGRRVHAIVQPVDRGQCTSSHRHHRVRQDATGFLQGPEDGRTGGGNPEERRHEIQSGSPDRGAR